MQLADFLDFDAIKTALPGGSKRSLLQQLANLGAQRLGQDAAVILASLAEREQLGSTGFGQGVAIPHGKIEGLGRIYGLFARLAEPVDYKSIDGRPVDLVFLRSISITASETLASGMSTRVSATIVGAATSSSAPSPGDEKIV